MPKINGFEFQTAETLQDLDFPTKPQETSNGLRTASLPTNQLSLREHAEALIEFHAREMGLPRPALELRDSPYPSAGAFLSFSRNAISLTTNIPRTSLEEVIRHELEHGKQAVLIAGLQIHERESGVDRDQSRKVAIHPKIYEAALDYGLHRSEAAIAEGVVLRRSRNYVIKMTAISREAVNQEDHERYTEAQRAYRESYEEMAPKLAQYGLRLINSSSELASANETLSHTRERLPLGLKWMTAVAHPLISLQSRRAAKAIAETDSLIEGIKDVLAKKLRRDTVLR